MENEKKQNTALSFGLLIGGVAALFVSMGLNIVQFLVKKSMNPALLAVSLSYAAATFLVAGIKGKRTEFTVIGVVMCMSALLYIVLTVNQLVG